MPNSKKASLGPGVTRSIVFDGALGLEDYDHLPRPWAHNGITTSTYTWWNFLPKNLFQQFRKAANLCVIATTTATTIPRSTQRASCWGRPPPCRSARAAVCRPRRCAGCFVRVCRQHHNMCAIVVAESPLPPLLGVIPS
jgi:hypothetical protein